MKMIQRWMILILSVMLLVSAAVPTTVYGAVGILGDADGDGALTIIDATQIQRCLADMLAFTEAQTTVADADRDGTLTILDATVIQRRLADFTVSTNVGGEIRYYVDEKKAAADALSARLAQAKAAAGGLPVLIRSYDTDDYHFSNTAYTYDNAMAAMAFISENRTADAEAILDAFVYVVSHDRYKPGRIRNAYAADTVYWKKDGKDSVKMPGWYDGEWCEDPSQVGVNVGNTSFAALALLRYDSVYRTDRYLSTARELMDWVLTDCTDGGIGFQSGCNGWPEEEGKAVPLTYKSTENNLDALVVFRRLYAVTGEEKYKNAADSALAFLKSMYNAEEGYFYVGTLEDGVTINKSVIALDAQVWTALALGEEFAPYEKSLGLVASMKSAEGAYPFCLENKNGGFWCEGTAFTALMYKLRGEEDVFGDAMDALCAVQLDSGLFPAATVDNLSTGIMLDAHNEWLYGKNPHIAPAAWFILAENGFNPYFFGE